MGVGCGCLSCGLHRRILRGRFWRGIRELAGMGEMEVTHGSTVATNAVLERRGARVGMVTTAGFEDVLWIGRQARPELYNFQVRRAEPLVTRALTFGLGERLGADGSVLEELKEEEMDGVVRGLREGGVESVAVCLLHSYRNGAHESRVAARLREEGFRVSASHEILPEYREFERWSTTAVNAYVAPLMARYLGRLQEGLGASRLRVMQSNGGAISGAAGGGGGGADDSVGAGGWGDWGESGGGGFRVFSADYVRYGRNFYGCESSGWGDCDHE